MYKDILRSIAGIEVFPLLSLFVFVAVFAIVLVWTSRLDGPRLTRLSRLPLDDAPSPAAAGDSRKGAGQ
jgi:hypothetical protein